MNSREGPGTGLTTWLGLTGDHRPQPGEVRPLWDQVPKKRYLAISIPLTLCAAALFSCFFTKVCPGPSPRCLPCNHSHWLS